MSIQEQITRIQTARNTMRTKLVELNLVESTANIDAIATAVSGIKNNGQVTANVKEGETYTIPAGWHDGSGTVSGVAGGGNYSLQSKTVTPTKAQQSITSDEGFYGLSDVVVAPIPENYQDVSSVTATAETVLTGSIFVDATGKQIAGTMTNNGAIDKTIDAVNTSYTVDKGFHDGTGVVKVVTETKSATPTKEEQVISATAGKVIASVTVAPIPDEYQVVTGVTATADKVLTGSDFVDAEGNVVSGTMANNGAQAKVLTTADPSVTIKQGYHDGTGAVSIVPEDKAVTPTKEAQVVAASEGKVLNEVTVAAIPAEYQVVTNVTAGAADVLVGKVIVDATGKEITGTMADNGDIEEVISVANPSVTIAAGKHGGEGTVSIVPETKSATPTKAEQKVTPTEGKVLSEVVVAPIPAEYQVVTAVTAGAADVLDGKVIVDATGAVVEGTMVNNGAVAATMSGLTEEASVYTIPAGYHDGTGTVSLTDDIETMLAAI